MLQLQTWPYNLAECVEYLRQLYPSLITEMGNGSQAKFVYNGRVVAEADAYDPEEHIFWSFLGCYWQVLYLLCVATYNLWRHSSKQAWV